MVREQEDGERGKGPRNHLGLDGRQASIFFFLMGSHFAVKLQDRLYIYPNSKTENIAHRKIALSVCRCVGNFKNKIISFFLVVGPAGHS